MKRLLSVIISSILILSCTGLVSFAETNRTDKDICGTSEEQLFNDIIEKDVDVLYEGNKKIEKLSADNDIVEVKKAVSNETLDLDDEDIDFYLIRNTSTEKNEEGSATLIADMEVEVPEEDLTDQPIDTMSSGGTKYKTKECGRVTA